MFWWKLRNIMKQLWKRLTNKRWKQYLTMGIGLILSVTICYCLIYALAFLYLCYPLLWAIVVIAAIIIMVTHILVKTHFDF